MPDQEKTIKGLHDLRRYLEDKEWSDNLVDMRTANVYWQTVTDAIALLKDQEAVEPDTDSEGTCICGNCGETVGYYPVGCKTPQQLCKFCPECGRSVKWNEVKRHC